MLRRKARQGKTSALSQEDIRFFDIGAGWLEQCGPVDILVQNVVRIRNDLTFDMVWRCLGCGETIDIDRPAHLGEGDDDYPCSCLRCGAQIGPWGTQRSVAKWLALEHLRALDGEERSA